MRSGRPNRHVPVRGLLPAVLAALAMFTQLLIPTASLAYEAAANRTHEVVLCTAEGAVTVAVPAGTDHHKGFAGLKCHDCVMASVAAVQTNGLAVVEPVLYAAPVEIALPGQDRPATSARAPPRPPSTAPPIATNA